MTKYFRITGYDPTNDFSFIIDSNGMFEEIWQFSSLLVKKGFKIIEVTDDERFLDINIEKAKQDNEHIILRANADGKPEYLEQEYNGILYKAIKVADKIYIPDRDSFLT